MQTAAKQVRPADVIEPIRCVAVRKPSEAQKHKRNMLRYVVLVIALLAVCLLIAIALYYTQAKSVTIEHVNLLAPQFILHS